MKIPKKKRNGTTTFLVILSVVLLLACVSVVFCSTLTLEIRLDGQDKITLDYDDSYLEPGATAILSHNMIPGLRFEVPVTARFLSSVPQIGDVTLYYEARFLWHHSLAARTVTFVDSAAPVIALTSNPDSFTLPGQIYEEEGYTATDNCDGDITHLVKRTVTDTEVIYTVTDSSGNTTEVRRSIRYDDPIPPELTLAGDAQINLTVGTPYTEPGFTAVDNYDGDLTALVNVQGSVNVNLPGTYNLTYTVTDTHGNSATATRMVTIEPYSPPDNVVPNGKVIYLTFDDGPCKYTDSLLDILARYNVKATFFVTNQSGKYASVMKRIVEDGHAIGIHSYSHVYSDIYASKERFFADFDKMRQLIYDHTGVWTTLHRFPGGSNASIFRKYYAYINVELVKDLEAKGYQYFDWNVDSGDSGNNKTADAVFEAVIAGIQKHEVSCVLQHDIQQHSIEAVARIIEWGLNNGYTFLPLDSGSPVFHQNINK